MVDRILDKYSARGTGAKDSESEEDGTVDDHGSFGFLRGSRERATMLELRKKDGGILAVAYGYMDKAEFDPSDGVTLHLAGQQVRIKGRNLNVEVHPRVRLYEAICRHRVPWLREADGPELMSAGERTAIIESIEW